MMEEKEKLCCPHCGQPLEDEETHACAQCGALYHQACWEAQGGCSNPACLPEQPEQEETLAVCPRCGAPWSDAHKFCAKCGMPKEACAPLACQNCGEPLRQGQSFCAKCGQKTQQEPFAGDSPAVQPPARKKSKTPVILAIVLAVLLRLHRSIPTRLMPKRFIQRRFRPVRSWRRLGTISIKTGMIIFITAIPYTEALKALWLPRSGRTPPKSA